MKNQTKTQNIRNTKINIIYTKKIKKIAKIQLTIHN